MHQLKLAVITHWGSAYDMVERLLEQIDAIRIVFGANRSSPHLIPSWKNCDILQAVAAALKPLKEMTDALSAEKSLTISAVKPLLNYFTTEVLVDKNDDVELTTEIIELIKEDMGDKICCIRL